MEECNNPCVILVRHLEDLGNKPRQGFSTDNVSLLGYRRGRKGANLLIQMTSHYLLRLSIGSPNHLQ